MNERFGFFFFFCLRSVIELLTLDLEATSGRKKRIIRMTGGKTDASEEGLYGHTIRISFLGRCHGLSSFFLLLLTLCQRDQRMARNVNKVKPKKLRVPDGRTVNSHAKTKRID